MAKFSLFKLPLVNFFFMGNLVAHDVEATLIYFCFICTLFFFINLKDVCVNVMQGNAQVLEEELNRLWLGFLGMVFDMPLAFHINLINSKCYIRHTYAIFFIIFFNTLRVSMCSGQIVTKNYYMFFLRIIDINDRFNVRSIIIYYNFKHIKDNLY